LRQQVEALGLIDVFRRKPRQGLHWVDPEYDHAALFRKLQPAVMRALERHNLGFAYRYGSQSGSHPSFASAVASIKLNVTERALDVILQDEDFNPNDPASFHVAVAYFLRTQERLHLALGVLLPPELSAAVGDERIGLVEAVEKVWWVLDRKHGARYKELQQRFSALGIRP
jgi:hypothetical protein